MIYFMIIASIIVADKILKEYFKSSFQGKHREVRTKGNGFGVRKEVGKQKVKENLFRKKEQNKAELKQKRNNKEKNDGKNIGEGNWREYLSPTIELLENKGAASGIMAKHPKILKIISAAMLCFCALALGKERQKGKTTMTGIGYALLLGGGISNFIDSWYLISVILAYLQEYFVCCFEKNRGKGRVILKLQAGMILSIIQKIEKK